MNYRRTTAIPNSVFDVHLPVLSVAELKVLLVIIRHTNGWLKNKRTKERRQYAWITHQRFMNCTGLSRRIMTTTIKSLVKRDLISVTNQSWQPAVTTESRRGRTRLYYACKLHDESPEEIENREMQNELNTRKREIAEGCTVS